MHCSIRIKIGEPIYRFCFRLIVAYFGFLAALRTFLITVEVVAYVEIREEVVGRGEDLWEHKRIIFYRDYVKNPCFWFRPWYGALNCLIIIIIWEIFLYHSIFIDNHENSLHPGNKCTKCEPSIHKYLYDNARHLMGIVRRITTPSIKPRQ